MSAPHSIESNKETVERPTATSALGFLGRGLRSVSSLVTSISTVFSSSTRRTPASGAVDSEGGSVYSGQTPESDESQFTHGSSPEASLSQEDSDNARPNHIAFATSRSPASRRYDIVHPRIVRTPVRRFARASASSSSQPALDSSASLAVAGSSSSARPRALIRREGAFYGELPALHPQAVPAPRFRGRPLRREQVYIEGADPESINPESELRGRDPRTIRENRYWRDSWGPLPRLADIVTDGVADAPTVIRWLQQRYGAATEPFWQAVDHIFPLPDGEEYQPRFERILRTSEWRNQSEDWVGGVEPVGRVREPARADDAADSEAEVESVGYVSDDAMNAVDEVPSGGASAGPSSMALVPASVLPPSSPSPSTSGLPYPTFSSPTFVLGSSSGTAINRVQKRTREPDHPTSSRPHEDRAAKRLRFTLPPPPPPASPSRPSPATRRRQTPRTHARNASFTYPPPRPAQTPIARSPPRSPSPPLAPGLPIIVYTPPSPCPSVTAEPTAAGPSSQPMGPPASHTAPSSSSSAPQFLAPPSPHRPRRSHRRRRSSPSPQRAVAPASGASAGSLSAPQAAPVSGGASTSIAAAHASTSSRSRPATVTRARKRTRDEAQEGEGPSGGEKRTTDDADKKKKRRKGPQ